MTNLRTSTPIKTAALLFLIVGLHGLLSLVAISNEPIHPSNKDLIVALLPAVIIFSIGKSLLGFLVAWFLYKQKLWAYILTFILIIPTFAGGIAGSFQMELDSFFQLTFSTGILFCLLLGRNDFKKNEELQTNNNKTL